MISKKSKAVYIILAILFGVFGVHQFYLKNYKKAIIYFLFSWTGIPYLCAICDAIRVNKIFNNLYRYKDENYTVLQKKNEDIESKEELGKIFKKQIKIEKSNCNDDVIDKKILINDFCNILTKVCNRENISKKEEREETVSFENKNEIRYHNENLSENNITLEKSNCNDDVIDKKILINDFCNILTKVCSRKNISKKEEKEETVSFKNKNEIKYHNENLSENNINLEKSNCNDDVINKKILISDFGNMVAKVCDRKTINKIEKKEEKISFDNKNKFKNIIENLSGNNRFYNESDIILEKYKHLITRDYIKCSIHEIIGNKKNGNKMISMELITDSTKFIKDSVKYSNTRGQKCSFKPLMCYWTTFDKLDAKQKKWYFYWRENVLKGNYIDTDLSYIILFVYELLNYSFNDNAAFNISMLERLYDAYLDRYKKLERYIKPWISDFLLELGEVSIGEKDYNVEDKIYINLNVSNDLIDKISITSWKPFIQYNETKFFEANKYKVYKVFKKNMLILNNFYCEKGTSVLKEWFDEKEKSTNLYLYNSAVIGREVKIKNISYIKHEPKAKMYHQITQIFRLSENIVRNQMNENRKIKVEINQIPEGYVEYLDIVLGDLKVDEKIKNRFKNVKNKEKDNSVEIPKRVYNEKIDKKPEISFDDELINNISSEGDSLIELFNQEYDDKLSNEVLFKLKEEKNYMNGLISKEELSEDNEIVKISKSIATEKVDEKSKIKFNDKLVNTIRSEGDALIELFNEEYGDKLKDDIHLNLKKENKQKEKKDINELFFKEDLSVDVDSFIKSLTNIEKRFICKFKNLEIYTKNAMEFSKENGKMASMLVDGINEKSMESLEDIFIELIDEKYTIYEDYRNVAKEIRRGN
ncbi:TerB N-terminal domain-containing protein [Clostridium sp.]|uniref:TerB N-terminal domain-containing protein n=1 Tax=Clostridium sp. TaxID=1506 RepID=UPI002605AA9B|nr:TerB N-terminal domain-containing protein [Clostridium sp.]